MPLNSAPGWFWRADFTSHGAFVWLFYERPEKRPLVVSVSRKCEMWHGCDPRYYTSYLVLPNKYNTNMVPVLLDYKLLRERTYFPWVGLGFHIIPSFQAQCANHWVCCVFIVFAISYTYCCWESTQPCCRCENISVCLQGVSHVDMQVFEAVILRWQIFLIDDSTHENMSSWLLTSVLEIPVVMLSST